MAYKPPHIFIPRLISFHLIPSHSTSRHPNLTCPKHRNPSRKVDPLRRFNHFTGTRGGWEFAAEIHRRPRRRREMQMPPVGNQSTTSLPAHYLDEYRETLPAAGLAALSSVACPGNPLGPGSTSLQRPRELLLRPVLPRPAMPSYYLMLTYPFRLPPEDGTA
jgi:hypothetical protein